MSAHDNTRCSLDAVATYLNPVEFARTALDFHPDPLQASMLTSPANRVILCCSRQWGKSTTAALKVVHTAIHAPETTIIIAGPTERQSSELFFRCTHFLRRLGVRRKGDGSNRFCQVMPNTNTRIIAIPNAEEGIRCFSAPSLILIDEASRVPDKLYYALVPMLATKGDEGALWLLSTPNGKSGFFYETWAAAPNNGWQPFTATASQCPRIPKSFLEAEARRLPQAIYQQEFECLFHSTSDALFQEQDIQSALTEEGFPPLFPY